MFTVYALYSEKFNKFYIGVTSDIDVRLIAHNHASNKGWTKRYKPWIVLYTEIFKDKSVALKREKQLKNSKGRDYIRGIIFSKYKR